MKSGLNLVRVLQAACVCLFASVCSIASAVPPTVPATPADAIPAYSLAEVLGPMTSVAPTMIAVLVAILAAAGIVFTIDFMWKRLRRHVR